MAKLTLSDLANLNNQTSAVNTINNNNTAIETALDNTLSRDGTSPNSMGADLDMNSHRVINLPPAVGNTEPIRLDQVTPLLQQAILNNPVFQGAPGSNGKTILSGTGIPSNLIGADGDFYLNLANYNLHGPKASGVWPSGVSLVGPSGPGGGDVAGPSSSTDNAYVRFNGTTGKIIKNGTTSVPLTDVVITGATTKTAPATNDELPIFDVAGAANKKLTLSDNLKIINGLTEDTAPVAGDYLVTYDTSAAGPKKVNVNKIATGKQTLWIPATAMEPGTLTNPPTGALSVAGGAGAMTYRAYDPTNIEVACFTVAMPKSWDEGTLTAQVYWMHGATTTNFGVVWGVEAQAMSDTDPLSVDVYTGANITDTGGVTNSLYISPETGPIDPGNTQIENDLLMFRILRQANNASDTLAVDALLIGVKIYYTTDANTDN